jgi:hypothetical protein
MARSLKPFFCEVVTLYQSNEKCKLFGFNDFFKYEIEEFQV